MEQILDLILAGLEVVYGRPWLALCVLILMFMWAGALVFRAHRRVGPYLKSARLRVSALRTALGDSTEVVDQREAFGRNYLDVAAALDVEQPGAHALVQAWREFHESIIDENVSPIRNTIRPGTYFHRAAPRLTDLAFASNVFVAVGLILTFIGLVVALHTAAGNMGDPSKAQIALTLLLTVASAKFLTSIGGIGASLWLRFAEQGLARKVNAETEEICALLERGLLYVPPQRLAAEQLTELREQTAQLKFFNQDVAFQLADRINAGVTQAFAPMASSLTALNENMAAVTQGIGSEAAKAIADVSGQQLQGLSDTLASLSQRLDAMTTSVGASGDHAAEQIRAAGSDFAQAATVIREAFDRLVANVDGMGGKLAEQGEAVARTQDEALTRVLSGLESAQARSAEAVGDAVKALQSAGAQAAETMQREVGAALAEGVAESQRTFRTALEEGGDALRGAALGLAQAVGEAAESIERASAGFVRSGDSAARTAEAMDGVTGQAKTAATSLGDAVKGFSTAAAPVAQAALAVNEAASSIARAITTSRDTNADTLRGLSALADGIKETQSAAETAWRDYRARFEGVDKALAQTAEKLGQTLGDSFDEFRRFAQSFDSEMAAAVSKLSTTATAIEEYAGALDEYVDERKKSTLEAAE
ncbi:anti-phage ZorAB system protein ZorA [Phenylobacterium sp.]|uniref:anti-phage ZorAB system protein ZorA n=1 Tax=Phenylobacterium sp. TaxID=1871053 RepID=UPI002730460A|nr:anti-phage ZorAB system protein ZorA [Phenylobacterium sp.]MDP1598721.1 anti-phage ZorAB system protein ZorA [Phenylobacterium sp.]